MDSNTEVYGRIGEHGLLEHAGIHRLATESRVHPFRHPDAFLFGFRFHAVRSA